MALHATATLVVNCLVPPISRIARRYSRFARRSLVINLVTPDDLHYLRVLEQRLGTHIEELPADFAQRL
jgi:hypothetical protein